MQKETTHPARFASVIRYAASVIATVTAIAVTAPVAHSATQHSQITTIQLTSTSGCVGDGGSFYPTFDRLVKKVAFTSSCDLIPGQNSDGNGELFVMNIDGTGLVQLTSTTGGIGTIHPDIDASGQKIVFVSDRDLVSGGNTDGNFEIFSIQVNGSGLAQLTHTTGGNSLCSGGGSGGNVDPRYNAGATKIVFGSDRDLVSGGNTDGNGELFEMNANGSGVRQLTHTTGGCGNGEPSLDATGSKVIFSSDRDLVSGSNTDLNYEIFSMNTNGTDIVQLTNTVNPSGIGSVAPHWTPDTNTIVFRGDGPGGTFQVFRMKGDGSGLLQMTWNTGGFGSAPWWISQDGKTMAVESDRDLVPGSNTDLNFEIYEIKLAP
jgi:Tol biopolymer transport system component